MCVKYSAKRLVHNGVEKKCSYYFSNSIIYMCVYVCVCVCVCINSLGIYRLPWWLSDQEAACQCRRHGFDLWLRTIPWRRKWLLQYFCQGNPMNRASWRTTVHGINQRVGHNLVIKQWHICVCVCVYIAMSSLMYVLVS